MLRFRLAAALAAALFALPLLSGFGHAAETVSFTALDGFELVGDLYEAGPGSPVVILMHSLGSDRSECFSLGMMLQNNGMNALAYDARGHGDSTKRGSETFTWEQFEEEQFADMTNDIDAALEFMDDRYGRDAKVGLVGSTVQSSTALVNAAGNDRIAAVVMFSPGLYYKGIDTESAMSSYSGRPVYMVAGTDDEYSAESMAKLKEIAGEDAMAVPVASAAQGLELLNKDPSLILKVEDWLERRLK